MQAPAEAPLDQRRRKRFVLFAATSATFLGVFSNSVVNIALPRMMADFGAAVSGIEWVVTAYMTSFAALLPLAGWLSDRLGRQRVFLGGISVFFLGAILCAAAPSLPWLVAARTVQAAGASGFMPSALAIIADTFEPAERPAALSWWGAGATIGPIVAPSIGGVLVDVSSWRAVFALAGAAAVVAFAVGARAVGRAHTPARASARLDLLGFAGLAAFLAGGLLTLNRGVHTAAVAGSAGLGVVALAGGVLFAVRARRPDSVVDVAIFRARNLTLSLALVLFRSFAVMGSFFLLSLFTQRVMGLSALQSGLVLAPSALALAAGMPAAGWAVARWGVRRPAVVGCVLMCGSLAWYGFLGPAPSLWTVVIPQIVRGAAASLLITPVQVAALNSVPSERAGTASSWMGLVLQAGGAFGVASLSAYLMARAAAFGAPPTFAVHDAASASAFEGAFLAAAAVSLVGLAPALALDDRQLPGTAVETFRAQAGAEGGSERLA